MAEREPLPGFKDRVPANRYCDLILNGGVTSSIAYPAAIFALATAYRFNSIGGSSSGAGAAALAAAAEYRRRHGSSDGYRILLERTAAVADEVDGKTRLELLFQPEQDNRRLFHALLRGFSSPSGKISALGKGIVGVYSRTPAVLTLGGFLVALGLYLFWAWLKGSIGAATAWLAFIAAALLFAIGVVLVVLFLLARDVGRLVHYDYGLCNGHRTGDPQPLTDWLHGMIQEIAGRAFDDCPLTFAELETAPGSPRDTLGDPSPMGSQSINLQMMTANITHGRPYVFPQKDVDEGSDLQLYFRQAEMEALFPREVVENMMCRSRPYDGKALPAVQAGKQWQGWLAWLLFDAPPDMGPSDQRFYPLPTRHLPIIVAARMSVSFPVLFSAVPLWVLDERDGQNPVFRRCLFCDGGICSAFPIHLFDSPVPSWPTFGISLHKKPKSEERRRGSDCRTTRFSAPSRCRPAISRAAKNNGTSSRASRRPSTALRLLQRARSRRLRTGTMRRWHGFRACANASPRSGSVPASAASTFRCPKNRSGDWPISAQVAALQAARRYAFPVSTPTDDLSDGWNEHRWVRLNVLRDSLSNSLSGLTWAAMQGGQGQPLRDLIRKAIDENRRCKKEGHPRLLAAQAAALEAALNALQQAERALTMPAVEQPYKPFPRPVMRVRPPFKDIGSAPDAREPPCGSTYRANPRACWG